MVSLALKIVLTVYFIGLFFFSFDLNAYSQQASEYLKVPDFSNDERIRVIVELDQDFVPEGQLLSEGLLAQRHRIFSSQDSLLKLLKKIEAQNVIRYYTVPFLAMDIFSNDLKALAAVQGVRSVRLDSRLEAKMNEAAGITGVKTVREQGFTGKGWSVAVLDTGVNKNHIFLQGKVNSDLEICILYDLGCPNGSDLQVGPGAARDYNGHGTHVAGIAVGNADIEYGGHYFSGTAPDAELIAMRIIDDRNAGWISETVAALERTLLINQWGLSRVAAVNLSIGNNSYYRNYCDENYPLLAAIIDNLYSNDIPVVVSTGNERAGLPWYRIRVGDPTGGLSAPACIRNAVAVGATTKDDFIAHYSNHNHMVDLLAPGTNIFSASFNLFSPFIRLSGTSMAAPQVAGAFALLKSAMPSASVEQMLDALKQTGLNINKDESGLILESKPRIRTDLAIEKIRNLQKTTADCIFNGLENDFPQYLAPIQTPTHDVVEYIYRCYEMTNACVGVYSGPDPEFFDQVLYLGPLTENKVVPIFSVPEASGLFNCPLTNVQR